jgi:hypothetical protein
MADNINRPSRSHRSDRDDSGREFDEDPLVELARIVSDDGSFFQNAPAKPEKSPEPETSEEAFSTDLEAELMEQFQASFDGEAAAASANADEPDPAAASGNEYADYSAGDSQTLSAMAVAEETQSEALVYADYERSDIYEAAAANDRYAPADPIDRAENDLPAEPAFVPVADTLAEFPENATIEPVHEDNRTAPDDTIASTAAGGPHSDSFEMEFAAALAETAAPPIKEDFTPEFGVEAYGRDPEFQESQASSDGLSDDDIDYSASQYAGPLADGDGAIDDAFEASSAMPPPAAARRGGRKGLIAVVGVLAVVVLGGGVAAYISKIAPNDPAKPAPVIKAEGGDVKIMADAADPGATAPSVLDSSAGLQAKSEEKLIDRIEEPQQIARVVLPDSANENPTQLAKPVGEPAEEPSASVSDAIGKTIDRVMQQPEQPAATPKFDPIGPRKVRTVVIKPDGSVVSNNNSAALPSRALPIEPAPPAVETMEVASVNSTQSPEPTPVKTMEVLSAPAAKETSDIVPPSQQPPPVANTQPPPPVMDAGGDAGVNAGESMDAVAAMSAMAAMIVPSGAVPRPKPADVPGAAVAPASSTQVTGAAARSASDPVNLLAAPAATDKPRVTASTAPAATIPSSAAPAQSGYVVQVSSQRSADQAKTSFADMQRRYNSILGGFYPNIQRADLGDKGTYYRVRIGPMKRESALHVCEQLKSAGGSCFVTR